MHLPRTFQNGVWLFSSLLPFFLGTGVAEQLLDFLSSSPLSLSLIVSKVDSL